MQLHVTQVAAPIHAGKSRVTHLRSHGLRVARFPVTRLSHPESHVTQSKNHLRYMEVGRAPKERSRASM